MKRLHLWLALFVSVGLITLTEASRKTQKKWKTKNVSVKKVLHLTTCTTTSFSGTVTTDDKKATNNKDRYDVYLNSLELKAKFAKKYYFRRFRKQIENASCEKSLKNGCCKKWKSKRKKLRNSLPVHIVGAMTYMNYFQWAIRMEKDAIDAKERLNSSTIVSHFRGIHNDVEQWLLWEKQRLPSGTCKKKIPILMPPVLNVSTRSNCVVYVTHEILQNFSTFVNCLSLRKTDCDIWSSCRRKRKQNTGRLMKKARKRCGGGNKNRKCRRRPSEKRNQPKRKNGNDKEYETKLIKKRRDK